MTIAIVRRATAEEAEVLGINGPAAYAEAYGYLWDRPDAYCDQLRTFGPQAFESLLARPEARVWIGEAGGTIVGFLSMIVGSVDPIDRRPGGLRYPASI
jgi:diamine N-acetyltransferase